MITDDDIKFFIKFLKQNNAFYNYLDKFNNDYVKMTTRLTWCSRKERFLDGYFVFKDTKEGFNYWFKLNDKYLQILKTRQLTLF
jgi:hypothetical protein